jgi:predicted permease
VRQLLIEGSVISILASVLGFVVAIGVVELFRNALRTLVQIDVAMFPSVRVFLLLVALTISTTIVCSVWPSLAMVDSTIDPSLREGGRQFRAGRYQYYRRRCLVAAEIAMSLTLIVACGLLLRTIYTLQHTPLGFQANHVIVANLKIPAYRFKGLDMGTQLYQPLLQRVRNLPGVENATLLTEVPLGKTYSISFSFSDRNLHAHLRAVGPEAQSVLGFPMLSGRFFNEKDIPTSPFVAVVNRAFAKAYLGNGLDPQRIVGMNIIGDRKGKTARVVGLLGDTRQIAVNEPSEPEIQICIPQVTPASRFYDAVEGLSMSVAVRTDQDASTLIPKLTKQIEFANPELGVSGVKTMDQIVENSYANRRMAAQLLTLFAGSALLLSIGGLYGLLAYLVTQRTREISIRIAIGASGLDISRLIISEAAWIILTGTAVGLFIISFSSRTLVEFLYGVTPHDLSTIVGATLLVLTGGLAAAYLPVHRAVRIDPSRALRVE